MRRILTPLLNVANHISQTKCVRLVAAHRSDQRESIVEREPQIPSGESLLECPVDNVAKSFRVNLFISPRKSFTTARSIRIFPLRFGRQPEPEVRAKLPGVVPTYMDYRMVISLAIVSKIWERIPPVRRGRPGPVTVGRGGECARCSPAVRCASFGIGFVAGLQRKLAELSDRDLSLTKIKGLAYAYGLQALLTKLAQATN